MEASSPSSPERLDAIRLARVDAVFDEGVKSWGAAALNAGMRFLPLDDAALRKMEKIGFPSAMLTRKHYPKMDQDIRTVDFSGWTFFVMPICLPISPTTWPKRLISATSKSRWIISTNGP